MGHVVIQQLESAIVNQATPVTTVKKVDKEGPFSISKHLFVYYGIWHSISYYDMVDTKLSGHKTVILSGLGKFVCIHPNQAVLSYS